MKIYNYSVVWYDEDKNKEDIDYGLCIGENFSGAVQYLEDFYGDCLVSIKSVENLTFDESPVVVLNQPIICAIRNEVGE